jgi:hypothetical protein
LTSELSQKKMKTQRRPLVDSPARTPGHQAGNRRPPKTLRYRSLRGIVNAELPKGGVNGLLPEMEPVTNRIDKGLILKALSERAS